MFNIDKAIKGFVHMLVLPFVIAAKTAALILLIGVSLWESMIDRNDEIEWEYRVLAGIAFAIFSIVVCTSPWWVSFLCLNPTDLFAQNGPDSWQGIFTWVMGITGTGILFCCYAFELSDDLRFWEKEDMKEFLIKNPFEETA